MAQQRPNGPTPPTPEQLAAFLDGELDPAAQRPIEEWLAVHPEDLAEIESMRTVQRLWLETVAPEPGEEAWAGVFNQVAEAVSRPVFRPAPVRSRRAAVLTWLVPALSAAAVLLIFGPGWMRPTATDYPVLSPEEVQIISMDAGDASALVVGESPHHGAIVMASADDVIVHASGPDVEVIMPDEMDQDSVAWPLVLVVDGPGRAP